MAGYLSTASLSKSYRPTLIYFPTCSFFSVWAVTTCWSLLSRKTPACSVGVVDRPATGSRTASLYATCQPVRFPIITSVTPADFPSQREQTYKDMFERCLQPSVGMSLFFFHLRLQPDVHHPRWSHHHQHQRDCGHP